MQCTQTHVLVCNRTHSNVTVLGVLLYTVVLVEKGFFFPFRDRFFFKLSSSTEESIFSSEKEQYMEGRCIHILRKVGIVMKRSIWCFRQEDVYIEQQLQ